MTDREREARIRERKVRDRGRVEIERSLDALRVYAADGRSSMPKRNARRCRDEVLAELQRLTEIEEAARLTRNAIIRDEKGFHGEWVAIPREDFDRLRTALEADTGGGQGE